MRAALGTCCTKRAASSSGMSKIEPKPPALRGNTTAAPRGASGCVFSSASASGVSKSLWHGEPPTSTARKGQAEASEAGRPSDGTLPPTVAAAATRGPKKRRPTGSRVAAV
eukprot:CAMPEP_0117581100 /NCGR_PEP_ID=MMETSP0784-20121206/65612_1 /TAXON_ID=39447 /ORGANISM="" /LENGTH=110 /DNA_ID=CAMNT_0005381319 /DNA_START=221 /DNA_END=553 /DNA_ORIENTATION=+